MTTPQQPGPQIPGFGPAAGYGGAPTQPLPAQPLPAQPTASQPYGSEPYSAQPYGGQAYGGQSYRAAPGEPDWSAMADQYDAQSKRKRLLAIAGGALAVCLVGGLTAFAWSAAKSGGSASADAPPTSSASAAVSASSSADASPSVSPSPRPKATPALRPDQVFAATLTIWGKPYKRVATDVKTTCWKGTWGGLGNVLTDNTCQQMLRATYTSGKVSVTVGVAALLDVRGAMRVAAQFRGSVAPLWHTGDVAFCKKSACALTHAVEGRFLYLTMAGPNSGAAGAKDRTSIAAGRTAASAVLARLVTLR